VREWGKGFENKKRCGERKKSFQKGMWKNNEGKWLWVVKKWGHDVYNLV